MLNQPTHYKVKNNIPEYHHRQSWWQIMRPLTLTGTISPIIVGTIVASKHGFIHIDRFAVLVVAAVLVQAGVNILNDYFDFSNGQDKERWHIPNENAKPFTGPKHKHLPFVAICMFAIAAILGLWLAIHSHPIVILIGIIGIYAGYKYSAGGNKSFSALGLGELIAALFLGIIPVMLAFIIQDLTYGWIAFLIGFLFALLISMMILTNNIRDIYKDEGFRQTIAIRIGEKSAVRLLTMVVISIYVIVTLLIISRIFPWSVLIVYFAIPIAYRLIKVFNKKTTSTAEVNVMRLVSQHHWIFSILLILGMLLNLLLISK